MVEQWGDTYPRWEIVRAELCPPQICVLKPQHPVLQNVTVFADGAFKEVIKL